MLLSGTAMEESGGVTPPLLCVRNLTASFRDGNGWKPVVRNLSFDIAPRETVAIVGESGSGKSVTALSIMRLLPTNSSLVEGSVRLAGRELLTLPDDQMRRVRGKEIAMIFQEPMTSLNPIFPIGRPIAEALSIHADISESDARAEVERKSVVSGKRVAVRVDVGGRR